MRQAERGARARRAAARRAEPRRRAPRRFRRRRGDRVSPRSSATGRTPSGGETDRRAVRHARSSCRASCSTATLRRLVRAARDDEPSGAPHRAGRGGCRPARVARRARPRPARRRAAGRPCPPAGSRSTGTCVADLLAARDGRRTARAPRRSPTLGALCDALDAPSPPELEQARPAARGIRGHPARPPPRGPRAELRAYQQHGVDWLAFLRDAELGARPRRRHGARQDAPDDLRPPRARARRLPEERRLQLGRRDRALPPGLRTAIYHGPKRELDPNADVTLTTYAVLRLDADVLAAETWDAVVLDEAQAIKN